MKMSKLERVIKVTDVMAYIELDSEAIDWINEKAFICDCIIK
jgi:hypothetical protein